ncbi:hypothetical protein AB0H29_03510 [Streptomyces thermolilacinus]
MTGTRWGRVVGESIPMRYAERGLRLRNADLDVSDDGLTRPANDVDKTQHRPDQ